MKFKTFRLLVLAGAATLIGLGTYAVLRPRDAAPTGAAPVAARPAGEPRAEAPRGFEAPRFGQAPGLADGARGAVAAPGLREVDSAVLDAARKPISGDKVKDAFRSRPYKVNLYSDGGSGRVDRVKIDLDRNNVWDEKWTFEGEKVKREVSPGGDERYTESYRLEGGAWVRKK